MKHRRPLLRPGRRAAVAILALLAATAGPAAQAAPRGHYSDATMAAARSKPSEAQRAEFSALHGEPTTPDVAGQGFDDEPLKAGVIRGKVSRVVDGDTLWVVREGGSKPMKVRIEGIDAPEICQDFGPEARRALAERVLHRDVSLKLRAVDDWGRRIGKVFDGDVDMGQRMVRDGLAWSLRYKWDRGPYMPDERMAQSFQRGLHASGKVEMPRDFRKRHGSCRSDTPEAAGATTGRGGGGG